jgi:DNA-binding NtrC family response regulator
MQAYARLGRPRDVVLAGASGVDAYRGFRRLMRRQGVTEPPELLREYVEACATALRTLEPPRAPGRDPVGTLARTASLLRPRRPTRPSRTISALDALITIGRSEADQRFGVRVARELAGMLGARVLFVRSRRRWLRLRPQAEHTLSTWTVLRLARKKRIAAFRIRPRPEFWRPEQRRPGGVLVFPLGDGVACLARRRPFRRRELAALRTVLRFLEARLAQERGLPADRRPPMPRRVPPLPSQEGLVGRSPAWREVLRQVGVVADSDCSVLLHGETGTGKEKIARALHAASLRSRFEFVALNCGAISSSLLASELFGHIRGAFTGADRTREGLFVRAHRGTLFLDEVADMPPEMQVALLRVLEDREVRPVGSVRTVAVDVRIVSASARDLAAEVSAGRFREDLYHRLDVVRIDLPPLRRRRDDIPLLVHHLLERTPERARLHPDALSLLLAYDWPGNVRELDNVLRAAAVLSEGAEITPALVRGVMEQRRSFRRGPTPSPSAPSLPRRQSRLLSELTAGPCSAGELAGALGVSVRTVNRDLESLARLGLVSASGEARARVYGRSVPGA